MKTNRIFAGFLILAFLGTGFAYGYEGGTKLVAFMNRSERSGIMLTPVVAGSPSREHYTSKPIVAFMQRMPKPTFSTTSLREERPVGPSTGTKLVVRFRNAR